ncbi:MAG: hypothetical protein WD990_01115 [Acidimicrobiia bacterium]
MVDRSWFTGRRLIIGLGIVLTASVLAVWVWWTAPHRELAATLNEVELPAGLTYLGAEQQGDRMCFFDNCPRLTRYYGSDREPTELSALVQDELPELEESSPLGSVCSYRLRDLSGRAVFLLVREPISEIPPENENDLIESRPSTFHTSLSST